MYVHTSESIGIHAEEIRNIGHNEIIYEIFDLATFPQKAITLRNIFLNSEERHSNKNRLNTRS